jgi:hypothetical protein
MLLLNVEPKLKKTFELSPLLSESLNTPLKRTYVIVNACNVNYGSFVFGRGCPGAAAIVRCFPNGFETAHTFRSVRGIASD